MTPKHNLLIALPLILIPPAAALALAAALGWLRFQWSLAGVGYVLGAYAAWIALLAGLAEIGGFLRTPRGDAHHPTEAAPPGPQPAPPGGDRFDMSGDYRGATITIKPGVSDAAPAPTSLHQLPAPPADFTGRSAELAELKAVLQAGGGAAICGLRGMGGIGKTALALVLAQELAADYPDAQLFLDLKGTDPQPLSPAQAIAHVLRAYHPTARLPESQAELEGLYRSALHSQHALLLMDNAAGAEQVASLMPPAGCLLLVTSRQHFTLPGLVSKNVDTLPPEDARTLLLRIATRMSDKCADQIAELCGCLPLALRLAGSALAERADLDPADYLRRLGEAQTRLDLVDASLDLSYRLLTAEMQGLWRALAVFPGDFDRAGAAAVWALEPDPAGDALGELARYSLVEWEAVTGRYRLHDLARLFAAERLEHAERTQAAARHAAHYEMAARAANYLYLQGGENVLRGLALFDLEWANIQAGQTWAAAQAEANPDAARLCSAYPAAAAYCLDLRLHPRQWIEWLEAGARAARRLGDKAAEGADLGNLGLAYDDLGEPRQAVEYYHQALAIAREIGDRRSEGNALGNLGGAYYALGDAHRAIEYYEQQLVITREIGDRRGEGNALGNLGAAYAALGQPRRAIEYYEQALAIHRDIGDRRGEGADLGNLSLAYWSLDEPRRAIEYYEQALTISRDIGDRRGEGADLGNLGAAYTALGQPRRAIEYHEQALAIAHEIGDRRNEGNWLGNLGTAYYALGEPHRAIEHYEQALAIHRDIGDRRGEGNALTNLGLAYRDLDQPGQARDYLQEALAIFEAVESPNAEQVRQDLAGLEAG
jgi:tetratricopeptide (TPR) repeat protein